MAELRDLTRGSLISAGISQVRCRTLAESVRFAQACDIAALPRFQSSLCHETTAHVWAPPFPTLLRASARKERLKMPTNPRSNEQKLNTMLNVWETLAPTKSFGGMTLE